MLAYKDGGRVRLVGRNGRDHTRRFADLAAAVAKLSARRWCSTARVAVFDQGLRSRLGWLREPTLTSFATPPRSPPCSCGTTRQELRALAQAVVLGYARHRGPAGRVGRVLTRTPRAASEQEPTKEDRHGFDKRRSSPDYS